MQANEIRQKFLDFFKERGHVIVPSSSLLPDDPSVLLTTAGMQQFKPYFVGEASPQKDFGSQRTASIQKAFRTVDIDEVGDETHDTFFEMLGHFSFGDYFKKETIEWAYEFLTNILKISPDRINVTVFEGDNKIPFDQESYDGWSRFLPKEKIKKGNREGNVWGPAGAEGPCGAANEVYVDDLEVSTLVFMEYYCAKDQSLTPLLKKGVDVGWGLERVVMVAQNAPTIFDTDLLKPLLEITHINRGSTSVTLTEVEPLRVKSMRIIADHIRGATFLMADGIRPSNVEQGYILRRVIRKAIRHASLLSLPNGIFVELINKVIELYKHFYPELEKEKNNILTAFDQEHNKFKDCLEKGLKEFKKHKIITGQDAFHLYDTYGFPFELTKELAEEQGIKIDEQEFNQAFAIHQETSRAGLSAKFGGHGLVMDTGELKVATAEDVQKAIRLHTATHLLHQALREVIGGHVQQRGSDITPERLRFDFTHIQKMTDEEKKKVEDLVNQKIKEDLQVRCEEMNYHDAIAQGALAFFKEKYPEQVKVYSIGNFNKEICGGPHVQHTGEIGMFRIKKEESSAAGIRRIRAVIE